jgi:hypothetical protein
VLFEMANLSKDQTGVEAVIYISTRMASYAPRIKWYPGRPKDKAPYLSVTIEPEPKAVNHHLPLREFEAASGPAQKWVMQDTTALLAFWNDGNTWMDAEVDAFKKALEKIA